MKEKPMEITIDPEFKTLIPAITPEEAKGLEESLLAEGCRDPLVIWYNVLLDGHHRYDICTRHNIPFKHVKKDFADRDQAKIWIISNQLGRRNLAPEQISYLRGLKYEIEKKEEGRPGGKRPQNDDVSGKGRTAEKLAKEFGVSKATIERDAKFAEAVDKLPEAERKEVLSGRSGKSKKDIVGGTSNEQENKISKPPRLESITLWKLKAAWNNATKTDRKLFIRWLRKEGQKV